MANNAGRTENSGNCNSDKNNDRKKKNNRGYTHITAFAALPSFKCQGVVKTATIVPSVLPELALMANTILDSCKAKMGTVGGFESCVAIMALWG